MGPDGIGLSLLQNFQEVAPALKIIFQRSLTDVEIPEDWRTVNVTPIFKKGVKSDPGNNRPVSLASVCCKPLESMVQGDLMKHRLRNDLLRARKHGYCLLPAREM